MPLALSSVVGTIRIEPLADEPARVAGHDSTLGLLLETFAHSQTLGDDAEPLRLVAAARLSCCGCGPTQAQASVRADLARLLVDLQAEYDELSLRQHP
jgi:hypothetical protein